MSFVLYRSPDPRPGHRGESLRTRRVAEAWSRIRRFLAECTDDPSPRSACLRVDAAVDDGSAVVVADSIASSLGPGVPVESSSGDERGWEWRIDPSSPEAITEVAARCEQHERRPRIHVNAAVRRHGSPRTPQVWATIAYDIAVRTTPRGFAVEQCMGGIRREGALGGNTCVRTELVFCRSGRTDRELGCYFTEDACRRAKPEMGALPGELLVDDKPPR